jgi:glycosyltransferase involved in cell wall biosynthesis
MPDISIVIPAYNEAKRIGTTLRDILAEFPNDEVIVVSDGSTDGTADIVRGFPRVRLLVSDRTGGKGAAIVKGMRQATGNVVGFLDADGSFNPNQVKRLIAGIDASTDCVIASKWIGRRFAEVEETTTRKLAGRVWNLLVRLLLGIRISDTQAGAKFMKREVFQKIDGQFICAGFEFDIELLFKAHVAGFRIKEMYVPFTDVQDSTFRYNKTPKMFWNLLRLWAKLRLKGIV